MKKKKNNRVEEKTQSQLEESLEAFDLLIDVGSKERFVFGDGRRNVRRDHYLLEILKRQGYVQYEKKDYFCLNCTIGVVELTEEGKKVYNKYLGFIQAFF